jgi:hypothetical protein
MRRRPLSALVDGLSRHLAQVPIQQVHHAGDGGRSALGPDHRQLPGEDIPESRHGLHSDRLVKEGAQDEEAFPHEAARVVRRCGTQAALALGKGCHRLLEIGFRIFHFGSKGFADTRS